ncbi:hypothetical protein B0H19DRAFT_1378962 [Mycena capillaripes]|nr:hypothetical protein B0H19DRAFT_1378962 [Mycena capillaripes]
MPTSPKSDQHRGNVTRLPPPLLLSANATLSVTLYIKLCYYSPPNLSTPPVAYPDPSRSNLAARCHPSRPEPASAGARRLCLHACGAALSQVADATRRPRSASAPTPSALCSTAALVRYSAKQRNSRRSPRCRARATVPVDAHIHMSDCRPLLALSWSSPPHTLLKKNPVVPQWRSEVGVFESPTRPLCASLPPDRFEVLQCPFPRSPRITAMYADCLSALRTHIARIPSSSLASSAAEYTRANLPPSTPSSLIPAGSQFTASYLRHASVSAYARTIAIVRTDSLPQHRHGPPSPLFPPTPTRARRPHVLHRPGAQPSPSPHQQPQAQHMTLPFLASFIASLRIAALFSSVPVPPSPVEARTYRRPRRPCPRRPSPTPASAAPAMVIPHRRRLLYRILAHPARLQQDGPCPSTRAPLPISNTTQTPDMGSGSPSPTPPRALPLSPALEASSCPAPQGPCGAPPEYASSGLLHRLPCAAPILCADAGLRSSKPRPPTHHERDVADRTAPAPGLPPALRARDTKG